MGATAVPSLLLVGDHTSIHMFRWRAMIDGFKVEVLSPEPESRYPFERDTITHVPSSKNRIVSRMEHLVCGARLCRSARFGVVNFHGLSKKNALLACLSNRPVVMTCLGTDVLRDLGSSRGFERLLLSAALKKARYVTMGSEALSDAIRASEPGIPAERLRIIRWGVDTDAFSPATEGERSELRKSYGVPEKAVVLLSIRALRPHYRILEIIDGFRTSITGEDFRLFVHVSEYGDAEYIRTCREAAAKDARILFHEGEDDPAKIPDYYRLADCSLHYPMSDAMPVSMLEAIAAGHLVLCEPGMSSYKDAAQRYSLRLKDLRSLNDAYVLRELARHRGSEAERDRAVLVSSDSRAAAGRMLNDLFKSLQPEPSGPGTHI